MIHRKLFLTLGCLLLVGSLAIADTRRRAVIAAPIETESPALSTEQRVQDASPFPYKLVATGSTTDRENEALANRLSEYASSGTVYAFAPIESFLAEYPESPWRASLALNRGLVERYNGFISASFSSFETAWALLQDSESFLLRNYANQALAELIAIKAGLGRMEELDLLLEYAEQRRFTGKAAQLITSAREGLASMEKYPERSFNCGPAALVNVLASLNQAAAADPRIMAKAATTDGLNFRQISELADEIGFEAHRIAYREGGAIPLPSILHWSAGHFSALVREENGRYLIKDPTLGNAIWVPQAAIDAESSGYFLLAQADLPESWRSVDLVEAEGIWGKGKTNTYEEGATRPYDLKHCDSGENRGMPGHSVHLLALSVNITDTPIWVNTPYGPSTHFTATYNQKEISLSTSDPFSSMGLNWTHNWQSWIDANPGDGTLIPLSATRTVAGGGEETFSINSGADGYLPQRDTQADLVALFDQGSLDGFELTFPDGSKWVYQHLQQYFAHFNARYFLTEVIDPYDNRITIAYDSDHRIRSVDSDATAAVDLRFSYQIDSTSGQPVWPSPAPFRSWDNLIRAVIGPQGRYATFDYDDDLMVKQIIDMGGLEASFSYKDVNSSLYVASYQTPHGATVFDYPTSNGEDDVVRAVVITDPEGQKERLEYNQTAISIPGELAQGIPSGAAIGSHFYDDLNTFYWGKRAMESAVQADGSVDYSQATLYHWMQADSQRASSVLHSMKRPLENRDWFIYSDSPDGGATVGASSRASASVRYVKDENGTSVPRTSQFSYNSFGNPTSMTDTVGRELEMNYAANGIDLLNVKQRTGAGVSDFTTLTSFDYDEDNDGSDDFPHLPSLITGADGVRLDLSYNSHGQIERVTRQKPDGVGGYTDAGTTDYSYYSSGEHAGFLQNVEGPSLNGARPVSSYTYDAFHRVQTATDLDDFTLSYAYDDLDRLTQVDYPDGTYVANVYEPINEGLDQIGFVDRIGRLSQFRHDALGRVVQAIDPKGQSTLYQWCGCDSLNSIIDPLGQSTTWVRDVQGRVEKKIYADDTEINYAYEPESSLLSRVTDPRGYDKAFTYFADGNLQAIHFDDGGTADPAYIDAPTVTYTYDPYFNRTATLTTAGDPDDYSYQYYAFTGDGNANRLQKVTISKQRGGQTVHQDIDYAYDALGRVLTRNFKGDTETYGYDVLDRLDTLNDPLGDYDYDYEGLTRRILSVQHAVSGVNGLHTQLGYEHKIAGGQERKVPYLQSITHSHPSGLISAHSYQRNENGWIDLWQQFDGSDWQSHSYRYDQAGQLQHDRRYAGLDENSALIESEEYRYDSAGNRILFKDTNAQLNDGHNALNQLSARSSEGSVLFHGSISEPGKVFVQELDGSTVAQNVEADLYSGGEFYAELDLPVGTHTVRIIARDIHGESSTQDYSYQVQSDPGDSFTHDLAGNLTHWTKSDGTAIEYKWDAANRLREIHIDSQLVQSFEYDGSGRMVRATSSGQSDDYYWDGLERLGRENVDVSPSVYRRYLTQGFTESVGGAAAQNYYVLRDHLGSTREVLDGSYVSIAKYDYSVWGEVIKVSGTIDADQLYTGHLYFADSDTPLHLAPYRAYQPELGRWLSRDFLGETGPDGVNTYRYSRNRPNLESDPTGLASSLNTPSGQALMAYLYFEAASTTFDLVEAGNVISNDCSTGSDYANALGAVLLGAIVPGPGTAYTNAAEGVVDSARVVATNTGQKLLPQFAKTSIDDVLTSSNRLKGQITEGARGIAKKQGHAQRSGVQSAFDGIKPTQANAESIMRDIFSNPSRTFYGDKVTDVYNAAGQGLRFENGTNRFIGFLEGALSTQ